MEIMNKSIKVSELNKYIKKYISMDYLLSDLSIEGEISNFVHHGSGHMYFSLKDDQAKIKSIMYKWDNKSLNFVPGNGKKVVAKGAVSIYEKEGDLQFYIKSMEEFGIGALYEKFINLQEKLKNEGLFDNDKKLPIPFFPKKIGVVTAPTGAAIRDIINIVQRRNKTVSLLLFPSLVQGEKAPESIVKGVKYLDSRDDIDCIIVGRGGGSFEELFAFNDEELAYTIFNSKTPIISAVGHEVDYSISDMVADLRAPTPSAAAEILVPDKNELENSIFFLLNNIEVKLRKKVDFQKLKLAEVHKKLEEYKHGKLYKNSFNTLKPLKAQMKKSFDNKIIQERLKMKSALNSLKSVDLKERLKNNFIGIKTNKIRMEDNLTNILNSKNIELLNLKIKLDGIKNSMFCVTIVDNMGKEVLSVKSIKQDDLLNLKLIDGQALVKVEDVNRRSK